MTNTEHHLETQTYSTDTALRGVLKNEPRPLTDNWMEMQLGLTLRVSDSLTFHLLIDRWMSTVSDSLTPLV